MTYAIDLMVREHANISRMLEVTWIFMPLGAASRSESNRYGLSDKPSDYTFSGDSSLASGELAPQGRGKRYGQ